MYKLIGLLAALVVACHGFPFMTRNGQANLYYVYTRASPMTPVSVLATTPSVQASPIDETRNTVVIIHGHSGSAFSSLNPIVKDAILTAHDVNVIVVDWSIYSSLSYNVAVGTVPFVAEELTSFIELLVTENKVELNRLHLVGFNLGAHVAGITGRSFRSVARITGLDPSGSQWGITSQRLRITDAAYVEVIHTDGGGISPNGIGTAIGRVDFFANGGSNQPGCFSHSCNHERAYELFASSMLNPFLFGYPCSTDLQLTLNLCNGLPLKMGGNELTKIGSGIYRVNTGRSFPF